MKKITLLAILAFAAFSSNANAQTSATVTATSAGAVLIKAMSLTQTSDLHFGSIVLVNATGGTVTLPSNSIVRTFSGGGVATSSATPIPRNAAYNVTGTRDETYAITLPGSTTVTHTTVGAGVNTMAITNMKARVLSAGVDVVTGTLSSTGTDSFTLGGDLTVQANQLDGIYAGTFAVTVDYN